MSDANDGVKNTTQSCGHPLSAIVGSDEGTNYCGECAKGWGPARYELDLDPGAPCNCGMSHTGEGKFVTHDDYAALRDERDAILSYAVHRLGEPTNKVGNDAIRWYALAGGEGR